MVQSSSRSLIDSRTIIPVQRKNNKKQKQQQQHPLLDFEAVSWIWSARCSEDSVTRLPNDLISKVLSFMTLKEAVKTSLVSPKWKYLWTTSAAPAIFHFRASTYKSRKGKNNPRFVDVVAKILKLHRAPTIHELKICLDDVDRTTTEDEVETLFKIIAEKRITSLWLSLRFVRCAHSLQYSLGSSGFGSVTSLHLEFVDISTQSIECLLSNSPLEELYVSYARCRGPLIRVCGPSLKLKHLHFRCIHGIRSMEISAPYLISFSCVGQMIAVSFKDVPCLVEVSFGCGAIESFVRLLRPYSSIVSQLESLILDMDYLRRSFESIPIFKNLKQLQVMNPNLCGHNVEEGLLCCLRLMEASPSLLRASVQLPSENELALYPDKWELTRLPTLEAFTTRSKHQCLREVEIVGFRGNPFDTDLVTCFAKYIDVGSVGRIIIINPNGYKYSDLSRIRARKLRSQLPQSVELEIL